MPQRSPTLLCEKYDTLVSMERPASVTVIAGLFFLVAAFLIGIGFADMVEPGYLSLARASGVTYGRELGGPQTAISVGAGWGLVAWGLFTLHNWARWCAILILVLGIAGSVPVVSAAARDLGLHFALAGSQVLIRIVVVWYLIASPEIKEAFAGK